MATNRATRAAHAIGALGFMLVLACAPVRRDQPATDVRTRVLANPAGAAMHERAPALFQVDLATTAGDVTIEVHRDWAPVGADRFYNLVRHGFYDGQRVFRVRAGFIAQFGLPGDPAMTAIWKSETMRDDPVRQGNGRGTLAYAMTGPDTRTTQIFINLADNPQLDAQGFAPFARVVRGMDVVDRLYAGYGETAGGGMRGGRQGPIETGGNAYLARAFPRLDVIERATVRVAAR